MSASTSNHLGSKAMLHDGIHGLLLQFRSSFSHKKTCKHPKVLQQICVDCGLRMDYGVAFDYIQRGLRYSNDEIARLRKQNSKKLLGQKRLQLVLDLDHTLFHTQTFEKLTSDQKRDLMKYIDKDVYKGSLYSLDVYGYSNLIKLRPFVRTFLKDASTMFEMYIYSTGSRLYVEEAAKFLDPEGNYFNSRIIAREDIQQRQGKPKKSLDLVLGEKHNVIILDDTKSVWESSDHKNLIVVGKYNYFKGDNCLHVERMKIEEESESDHGALVNVLEVLNRIYALYFCGGFVPRDVRVLLKMQRRFVLSRCVVFYTQIDFITSVWAETLGAKCRAILDSSITHVVSTTTGTKASQWALREKKFLVHPRWIDDAYDFCYKPPEKNYFPSLVH